MPKLKSVTALGVLALVSLQSTSHADIDELLSRYTGDNGRGYIEPLVTGFGAGLNSGLYNSAGVARFGLKLQFETRFMGSLYSSDQKTFAARTAGHFSPPMDVDAPTVVGDGGGAFVEGDGGTRYYFPGGLEIDALYLVCPQVTVGSFFGTEAKVRFIALPLGEDLGRMTLWGFGGRHSISQYIPLSPLDVSMGAFYQKFALGDLMDASLLSVHLVAGKSLPLLNFYGGLGYESCTMHIEYTFVADDIQRQIEFDLEGENRFRATLGVGLDLFLGKVNADLSLGRQTVISVGLGFGT